MKVLLIEDENLAMEYLEGLLIKSDHEISIVGKADSVKNAIKWFLKNPLPDLVFMDVDLGDGLCFELFEVIDVQCPIVFTTAYDEYAIQAFKVNSIDYLLKPFELAEVNQALEKFSRLAPGKVIDNAEIKTAGKMLSQSYKERFIIKIGEHLKTLPIDEIMFFTSMEKATFAVNKEGRHFPIDYSLDNLLDLIDPNKYFIINVQINKLL